LRRFYKKYSPRLLAYTLKKVDRKEDAEEIVQDALLSAFYSLPSFLGKSSFSTWLYGILRHEMADFYRKKKVKEVFFSHFPGFSRIVNEAISPEVILERKRIQKKILFCFHKLSEGYCHLLRLKYIEGLKTKEVARRLKISYKAAEMRLRRARFAFIKLWNEEEGQENFSLDNSRNLSFIKEYLGFCCPSLQDTAEDSF